MILKKNNLKTNIFKTISLKNLFFKKIHLY